MQNELLSDIEDFLKATGLSAHRFGVLSARNGRVVDRLREGGRVWPETEMQIRVWLKTEGKSRLDNAAHAGACKPVFSDNPASQIQQSVSGGEQ